MCPAMDRVADMNLDMALDPSYTTLLRYGDPFPLHRKILGRLQVLYVGPASSDACFQELCQ
jgi:hypothetical protein